MANPSRKHSGRSGSPDQSKMSMSGKSNPKTIKTRTPRELDDVTDAPESGEPREQGRSRGRAIDREVSAVQRRQGNTPSQGSVARKGSSSPGTARANPKGPRAMQKRDESDDTANEAWESGRQKATS